MTTVIEDFKSLAISDSQAKALHATRALLGPADGDVNKNVTDNHLLRFLVQHSHNEAKAAEAYQKYLKWRTDEKVDSILEKPYDNMEIMSTCIPYAYHGYDNEGRPIYMEKTGKIAATAIAKHITTEQFMCSHIYGMEFLARRCEEQTKKLGRLIDTFSTIIDLDGLSLGHRAAIPILKASSVLDADYYPGRVEKILLINAPSIMPILFKAVSAFLDPIIKSRIHVVAGDPKLELPKHIPKESLPVEYGGECNCPGGCIPVKDASALISGEYDDGMEKKNVPAGSQWVQTLECGAEGGNFSWQFLSEGSYDIDFAVTAVKAGDSKEIVVKANERTVSSKGSYTAHGACVVTIVWDNTFSYFNSKDIKYVVAASPLVDGFEATGADTKQ